MEKLRHNRHESNGKHLRFAAMIAMLGWLIRDIRANGVARSQAEADDGPVPEFDGAPE